MGWLFNVVKTAIEAAQAIYDTWEADGKDVKDLAKGSWKVSVSFQGGEGDAIVEQRDIEAMLPDGD